MVTMARPRAASRARAQPTAVTRLSQDRSSPRPLSRGPIMIDTVALLMLAEPTDPHVHGTSIGGRPEPHNALYGRARPTVEACGFAQNERFDSPPPHSCLASRSRLTRPRQTAPPRRMRPPDSRPPA